MLRRELVRDSCSERLWERRVSVRVVVAGVASDEVVCAVSGALGWA